MEEVEEFGEIRKVERSLGKISIRSEEYLAAIS